MSPFESIPSNALDEIFSSLGNSAEKAMKFKFEQFAKA